MSGTTESNESQSVWHEYRQRLAQTAGLPVEQAETLEITELEQAAAKRRLELLRQPGPLGARMLEAGSLASFCPEAESVRVQLELLFLKRCAEQRRRDPLFTWRAYRVARQAGLPIPGWVLEYFDGCAAALASEVADPASKEDRVGNWLPGALGFTLGRGGKGSGALAAYRAASRDLAIFWASLKTKTILGIGTCPWCNGVFGWGFGHRCQHCAGTGNWPFKTRSTAVLLADPLWPLYPFGEGEAPDVKTIAKIINKIKLLLGAQTSAV